MRPTGIVRLYQRGQTVWECSNIFVNAGLPALANLVAGITAGQSVSAVGFGSGATAPAATDTGLRATPAYYNSVGAHTFPSGGSVQFNYSFSRFLTLSALTQVNTANAPAVSANVRLREKLRDLSVGPQMADTRRSAILKAVTH